MTNRLVCAVVIASGAFTTTFASAASDSGVDLGVRLGYGIPMGKATGVTNADGSSDKVSDAVTGSVPIWIDAGYRFTPNIMAGLYFDYAFAFTNSDRCPSPASCSAHDMRLGIQGQYRIMPGESVDPWFGIGVGLEWLGLSASASTPIGDVSSSTTGSGFEFLDLQGGADFQVTDALGIGPFVSFSLGQYNSYSVSCDIPAAAAALAPPCPAGGDITDKALHEWLILGVRGVVSP